VLFVLLSAHSSCHHTHTLHVYFSQKLLTMHSVFLASLLSSPKGSKNCSISFCRVALRSSAAARVLSDSVILFWTAWYRCCCCVRLAFNRRTSTCSSSFRCSRLMVKTREGQEYQNGYMYIRLRAEVGLSSSADEQEWEERSVLCVCVCW